MELGTKTRVVCIGDDITEGSGSETAPSVNYPSLLQEFLGDEYAVFNEGVNCEKQECSNCGWNPDVAQRRKEALYERQSEIEMRYT